jgi:hypothetical protein
VSLRLLCAAALVWLACAPPAAAQQRYAIVVSGASGGELYASRLGSWREAMVRVLGEKLGFEADHVLVFAESTPAVPAATRERIGASVERLAGALGPEDLLLIVLMGHGSFDGVEAKFNLVGPDFDAAEWRDLLRPLRARLVLVNTTGASFPFLERLSGPRRTIITATESAAQRFDTIFPEFFAAVFEDDGSDLDKDGRVSLLEAFSGASRAVKQHYERRGQLPIERAMIDDNGDGVGKWAGAAGPDGAIAARTFLDSSDAAATTDAELADLFQRRAALESQVDELRSRKPIMPPEDYMREFEQVMIELARVSRDIRRRKS